MINLRWEPDGSFEVEADSAQDLAGLMTMSSWQGVKDRLAELMKMRPAGEVSVARVSNGHVTVSHGSEIQWPTTGERIRVRSDAATFRKVSTYRVVTKVTDDSGRASFMVNADGYDSATEWYSNPRAFWNIWERA